RGLADAASMFFLVFALAMLSVRLFAGRVQDRYGENAVIPGALAAMALALLTIGLADSFWHIVIAAVLGGIGQGVAVPSLQAVGIQRTTPNRIPIATSTHYLALDTGIAVGPVALGFMIPLAGYPGLYFVGAGVVVIGALVYWIAHGRHVVRSGISVGG
ncbi:MAG: MFS transporter, partial [Yaniella sp.]|nr:MFS transporter [Yaniella sp.]